MTQVVIRSDMPMNHANSADDKARGILPETVGPLAFSSTTSTSPGGTRSMACSGGTQPAQSLCVSKHTPKNEKAEYGVKGEALSPGVSRMVSLVMTGMGNTAGAVMVHAVGGFGVTPRTRSVVSPGTVMKHLEGSSVAKHCEYDEKIGYASGGLPHHTECGTGLKRKRSVRSPVPPGASAGSPGTGMPMQANLTRGLPNMPPKNHTDMVDAYNPMTSGNSHLRVMTPGLTSSVPTAGTAATGGSKCTVKASEKATLSTAASHAVPLSTSAPRNSGRTLVVSVMTAKLVPGSQVVVGGVSGVATAVTQKGTVCGTPLNEVGSGLVLTVVVVVQMKEFACQGSALTMGMPSDMTAARLTMGSVSMTMNQLTLVELPKGALESHSVSVVLGVVVMTKVPVAGTLPSLLTAMDVSSTALSASPGPMMTSGRDHHLECRSEHSMNGWTGFASAHCRPHTVVAPTGLHTMTLVARGTVDTANGSTVALNTTVSSVSLGATAVEMKSHPRCSKVGETKERLYVGRWYGNGCD